MGEEDRTRKSRRTAQRFLSSFQATLYGRNDPVVCTVANISAKGAMIQGHIDDSPGDIVHLEIPQLGRIPAIVVWNDGESLGVSFQKPGSADADPAPPDDRENT